MTEELPARILRMIDGEDINAHKVALKPILSKRTTTPTLEKRR